MTVNWNSLELYGGGEQKEGTLIAKYRKNETTKGNGHEQRYRNWKDFHIVKAQATPSGPPCCSLSDVHR
jgi:hypothetical protein